MLLAVVQIGCSPSARLNRLLSRHPELKISDTLFISDTIIFPHVVLDTLIKLHPVQDTIVMQNDRLEVRIERIHDTLYLRGKCKADTVVLHRVIPVEKIKVIKPDTLDLLIPRIPWLISGLICLLAFLLVFVLKVFR